MFNVLPIADSTWNPQRHACGRLASRSFGLLAAASVLLVLTGCAATTPDTVTQTPAPQKVGVAADVVTIHSQPFPEGPTAEWRRTDPNATEVFALLPDVLPDPLPQPPDCEFGNVTTLTLTDGTAIRYGPCDRPPSIDAIRCAAYNPSGHC